MIKLPKNSFNHTKTKHVLCQNLQKIFQFEDNLSYPTVILNWKLAELS